MLDGVDLTVAEGTIFSSLRPSGAGTATVRILSTLVPADNGAIRVVGHDLTTEPDAVRAAIGAIGPPGACAATNQRYYVPVVSNTE